LTATLAQFGLANRLAVFERGIPIRFPIAAASVSKKAMGVRHN
jgi:phage tail protein X